MDAQRSFDLTGHSNPIFSLELSQKPGILFTGGNDKGVVEWGLPAQAFIKVMFPVPASIYAIHCPVGYPLMLAGLRNGEVLVFNLIEQKITHRLRHHIKPIFDIKSLSTKDELLVASEDGKVSVWSLKTMDLLHTIDVSHDTVRCIAVSPDEKQLAFGCRDSRVVLYDALEYAPVKALVGHIMAVFTAQYAPNSSYLLSGGRDAQLKIWDSNTFELIKSIPAHMFAINHICFHPSRPYFATASMDKSIKIWDAAEFRLRKIISREKGYDSHALSVNKLAWDADRLLSVSDDKKVIAWDIAF